jgi:endoglucanase
MPNKLPRWRGFNLLDFYSMNSTGDVREDDFRWMSDWGFDFVRLPSNYVLWTDPNDVYALKEEMLEKIDRAVDLGRQYNIHVSLNFHRAPGYCVNPGREEPFNLWKDQEALDAFCFHWQLFAKRYSGIPSGRLSFDLVNEPPAATDDGMTRADHERVIRAAVNAIRRIDPDRLIMADGLWWGNAPSPELADLGIGQSCRAYAPMGVSHYKATWVGGENYPMPTWPGISNDGQLWDRARLEQHYAPWCELASQGVGVHCGEGGAFKFTPHDVFLRWFREVLEVLTGNGIGYSLWNLRGTFGIVDSERSDVDYEDWQGHKLDRKLLELLQEF